MNIYEEIKLNIEIWLENKVNQIEENKLKKKYPNWSYDMWSGDFEFIWGVKSWDDLTGKDCNIHTMNDIDICYDHSTGYYSLGLETAYMFGDYKSECDYLLKSLSAFENFMSDRGLSQYRPFLFMQSPVILDKAESLEELFTNFKMYVKGYCTYYSE